MKIYPYNTGSQSAKALSQALGVKRLKHEGGALRGTVINWGSSAIKRAYRDAVVINNPEYVAVAANKLSFFKCITDQNFEEILPRWTTKKEQAILLIEGGSHVVCRTILNGHSGAGIVIAKTVDELVDAPLYVEYIKKQAEYRVHVHKGKAFFVQKKMRKLDVPDDAVNWQIRNHQNGFIYANKGVVCPENVTAIAVLLVGELSLDFGAVDVIVTKKGQAYVLEVNTAAGLTGATLDAYVKEFQIYK